MICRVRLPWRALNYFNYFTEIEEHFQRARNSGTFLLSPLDWALIEIWKDSGIPLEAVCKGIDRAFEKWHVRKRRTRAVNSVAYCSQEVLTAARELAEPDAEVSERVAAPAFDAGELAEYFRSNAELVRRAGAAAPKEFEQACGQTAVALDELASAAGDGVIGDLETVEQRLTVLEERLLAAAVRRLSEDQMLTARQELDRYLTPYRGKMTADQLVLLEKQFLQRQAFETAGLPRLSLFYLK